ncbi:MAG: signal peptide peptidase SppA, partial [Bacteroidetes bacterium]|nr:signal peptide peptidase SppA [Bacteroidota bacterium]
MLKFLKYVLATMVGFLISVVLFVLLSALLIAGSFSPEEVEVKPNSVLKMKFDYEVKERTSTNFLDQIDFTKFSFKENLGLNDILKNIKKAETDDNIKGIYIDLNGYSCSYQQTEEIRNAVIHFKETGKFVVAYGDLISQRAYYLASCADKIFLMETGYMDFRGLSVESMYFKRALDRLEIKAEIFYAGKFKSATEPLRLDSMSPANREQTSAWLGSIYSHLLTKIAESRSLDVGILENISNELLIRSPEDALKYGLVDELGYQDHVIAYLKAQSGLAEDDKLSLMKLNRYHKVKSTSQGVIRDRIAVIYATGDVVRGSGGDNNLGSDKISKAIRDARRNDKVKAIVMRINSPGGDAFASDIIWREVALAAEAKPFIVSMGDVAASGGYFIACAADVIVAQPTTITGSIGVFGILLYAEKFFDDKLGITFDRVTTGKFSDLGSGSRPLTEIERKIIQTEVDKVYDVFVTRVAE